MGTSPRQCEINNLVGSEKMDHYQRIPLLLARLGDDGIAAECLRQYDAAPEDKHDPVSIEFLSGEGQFRSAVVLLQRGGAMPPALAIAVQSLRDVSIDDSYAEGPHARMGRLQSSSRGARWAWSASTLRLEQNLKDLAELPRAADVGLQNLWDTWSSVLKPPGSQAGVRMNRLLRRNKKLVLQHVYHMDHYLGFTAPDRALEGGDGDCPDVEEPEDGEGAPPGAGGGDDGGHGGDEDGDGDGDDDENPGGDRFTRKSEEVKLMRHYLSQSAVVFAYMSCRVQRGDDVELRVFQFLDVERANILVDTWYSRIQTEHLFSCVVQPLEIWNPTFDGVETPQSLEVFVVEDPTEVDFIELCGVDPERRSHLLVWESVVSDVEDCVCLKNPKVARPLMNLSSPSIPILSLTDELAANGWTPTPRRIVHTPDGDKSFDNRNLSSRRKYLQVLLALDSLWEKGYTEIRSSRPASYFSLVLRSKRPVEIFSDKACKKSLAELSGDVVEVRALEMQAREPRQKRPRRDVEIAGDSSPEPNQDASSAGEVA